MNINDCDKFLEKQREWFLKWPANSILNKKKGVVKWVLRRKQQAKS